MEYRVVKEREKLGFSNVLEEINPDEWEIKKRNSKQNDKSLITQAAIISGFKSREAKQISSNTQRRRRTGRNVQFNLKARPETIQIFSDIADQQGWGLGETLEKAVYLLQKEYSFINK